MCKLWTLCYDTGEGNTPYFVSLLHKDAKEGNIGH